MPIKAAWIEKVLETKHIPNFLGVVNNEETRNANAGNT